MAIKSANVVARVELDIKEKAETILTNLGILASTAVNMFYRQVVLWNGIPFRLAIHLMSGKHRLWKSINATEIQHSCPKVRKADGHVSEVCI